MVENGRRVIEWLIEQGSPSPKDDSGYHLTREGGHSARRVDSRMSPMPLALPFQDTLTRKLRNNPDIDPGDHIAIDLITGKNSASPTNAAGLFLNNRTGKVVAWCPEHADCTGSAGRFISPPTGHLDG